MPQASTPGTFIPKDAATATVAPRRRSGGLNDLLLLAGIVLFVASLALGGGVVLYGQYLSAESKSKVAQLTTAEQEFEPQLINSITVLDDRMHAAENILSQHIAPSVFLAALQTYTLQTVSFQTLDFEAPDQNHITVKMQGIAQSVNSIALQAQIYTSSHIITSPIFSNIAREPDGVHFDLAATIDPTALNYATLITEAAQQQQGQTQGQQSQPQGGAQGSTSQAPAQTTPSQTQASPFEPQSGQQGTQTGSTPSQPSH